MPLATLRSSHGRAAAPRADAVRTVSRRGAAAIVGLLALTSVVAACGDSEPQGGGTPGDPLEVMASFYPLQWMAQQVGGDRVRVASLTKPGAEPHDLELTPLEVGAVQDADVVAYLSGFQPAVDDVLGDRDGTTFDAADAADLNLRFTPIEDGSQADEGTTDPHFWLDPTRMADVADAFATTLAERDPDHADDYRTNAKAVRAELASLDADMEAGLSTCANRTLVTSHNAFGYLAQRYDLDQVGITGLTPEDEPSPKDLAAVSDLVEEQEVDTIYFETLVSPAVAQTVAEETGAQTRELDPIEGLTEETKDADYLSLMRSDLDTIRQGQPCS